MRDPGIRPLAFALVLLLAAPVGGFAQSGSEAEPAAVADGEVAEDEGAPLTEDELEVVVARIALYPDELVALVVAASLYPLQIVEAARYLDKLDAEPDLEPDADWDGSVISLLNYPDIVHMMSDDLDWTQLVGDLAINQQKDMLVAIQQLRDEAVASGVLQSNDQTVVVEDNDNIVIESPDPEIVYVPTYPPEMLYDPTYVVPATPIIYSDPYPSYYYPSARFWTGVATGVATAAVFGAVVDWNDWGTWGGKVDVDVNIDKIKIDRGDKINFKGGDKNFNVKNVDRSNVSIGDRTINKTEVKNNLKGNDFNRVSNKVDRKTVDRSHVTQVTKGKDVRTNVQAGLKNTAAGPKTPIRKPPAAASRPKPKPPAAASRPAAKPAAAKRPTTSELKKKATATKPGARPDHRPSKPSLLGNPGKGKPASISSNRGHSSRGGGIRGGSPRGGGIKRGGGRR